MLAKQRVNIFLKLNWSTKLNYLLIFTLFLISFTTSISAQNTQSVDALNKLSWELCFSNTDSSKKIAENALKLANQLNYKKGTAEAQSKLAVIYDISGYPEKALPLFLSAIKQQEQIKDSSGLSFSYNNLGLMYYAQYNYPEALFNLKKSLQIDEKTGDKISATGSLVNIGIVYTYIDSLDEALQLYNKALAIYTSLKDTSGIMSSYSNIAKIHYSKEEYAQALDYYKKNEIYLKQYPNSERISAYFNAVANTYLKMKNFALAESFAFKDLEVCEKNQLLNRKQFAYETLNVVYSEMGNYQKAHQFLTKYTELRDSILNENRNSTIAEIQTKYEIEKKENEILRIQAEKENEISKSNTKSILLFAISFFSIIIIAFILWAYLSKKKINTLLKEKNILDEEIIKQKEMMMGEVHHRVKNNLQLITSIIELQLKSINNETAVSHIQDIQKRVESIAILHQFLYQSENVEKVEMNSYIIELSSGLKKSFSTSDKNIEMQYEIPTLWVDLNTAVPLGLIINELVTNSFKHAFKQSPSGKIVIKIEHLMGLLVLKISDNGSGMDSNQTSTSFGLKMIKSLCRQLNANWNTQTENGVTNTFEIKRFKIYE
jgi:two-component sensor histidine kinase